MDGMDVYRKCYIWMWMRRHMGMGDADDKRDLYTHGWQRGIPYDVVRN